MASEINYCQNGRLAKVKPGQKNLMASEINYCQNGRLAKVKVTHVIWTQALQSNRTCNF